MAKSDEIPERLAKAPSDLSDVQARIEEYAAWAYERVASSTGTEFSARAWFTERVGNDEIGGGRLLVELTPAIGREPGLWDDPVLPGEIEAVPQAVAAIERFASLNDEFLGYRLPEPERHPDGCGVWTWLDESRPILRMVCVVDPAQAVEWTDANRRQGERY